mmetsp:Transcript_19567/g.20358  ORF Transcript_19567/g.20358 Transcript_19567/m.20358 type:complete len:412 (+) Transcript_19567:12-1247(+)
MNQEGPEEVYEFYEDTVDNFDELNSKYRDTYEWIAETDKEFKKTEPEIFVDQENPSAMEVFKILSAPEQKNQDLVNIDGKYFSKKSDPFERLLALKHELADCKKDIDDYADIFKENSFISNRDNFSALHEEINLYKAKVDAFIDYNVFNSLKNEQSTGEGEEAQKFTSNYDKNSVLISSIISQIKSMEDEMKSDILGEEEGGKEGKDGKKEGAKSGDYKTVSYEVLATPENQINLISTKISSLESDISKLHKIVGDWSLYDNNESICSTLNKLMNFSLSKAGEKYEKKFQTAKDCANIINTFSDKKNDEIVMGSYYVKIKELYAVLELCENFDQVFEYITKRFQAIKMINEQSDQFGALIDNLSANLKKIEDKSTKMKSKFEEMLKEFDKYQEILQKMDVLEGEIKKELLI